MGLFRKAASISTMGLIDFRSDKERIARYTRQTRNAVRAQTAQQRQIPAGWYSDPQDARFVRWWDGYRWTDEIRPS